MGGPSLTLKGDASPLREMTKKVRRALGKADTQELLAAIGSEIVATTNRRFEAVSGRYRWGHGKKTARRSSRRGGSGIPTHARSGMTPSR